MRIPHTITVKTEQEFLDSGYEKDKYGDLIVDGFAFVGSWKQLLGETFDVLSVFEDGPNTRYVVQPKNFQGPGGIPLNWVSISKAV